MDVSFFTKDNTKKIKAISGAYEWWYADFMDFESGLSGVIIFYWGNLFSPAYVKAQQNNQKPLPENHPAVSVSLYKDAKPIYYFFKEYTKEESKYFEQVDGFTYRVGRDIIRYSESEGLFAIDLDQLLANGSKCRLELSFKSAIKIDDIIQQKGSSLSQKGSPHDWRCLMPKAYVSGQISINGGKQFKLDKVLGYHDHNMGVEPLHHYFSDWYWGRCHLSGSKNTLIYYCYQKEGEIQALAWLISEDGFIEKLEKVEFHQFKRSIFGLNRATEIEIDDHFIVQIKSIVDHGPFYERYQIGVTNLSKQTHDLGVAEYIRPDKIYASWVHPLVNMRLCYSQKKASFIQRSKRLYKWTWSI